MANKTFQYTQHSTLTRALTWTQKFDGITERTRIHSLHAVKFAKRSGELPDFVLLTENGAYFITAKL